MLAMVHGGKSTPEPPAGQKNCLLTDEGFHDSMGGVASTQGEADTHPPMSATAPVTPLVRAGASPKFGQSELLQRENIKRLRRQQENSVDAGKGGLNESDRQSTPNVAMARKSINPRKTSAMQAEVVREVQLAAKRGERLERSVREAVEDKLRAAAEAERSIPDELVLISDMVDQREDGAGDKDDESVNLKGGELVDLADNGADDQNHVLTNGSSENTLADDTDRALSGEGDVVRPDDDDQVMDDLEKDQDAESNLTEILEGCSENGIDEAEEVSDQQDAKLVSSQTTDGVSSIEIGDVVPSAVDEQDGSPTHSADEDDGTDCLEHMSLRLEDVDEDEPDCLETIDSQASHEADVERDELADADKECNATLDESEEPTLSDNGLPAKPEVDNGNCELDTGSSEAAGANMDDVVPISESVVMEEEAPDAGNDTTVDDKVDNGQAPEEQVAIEHDEVADDVKGVQGDLCHYDDVPIKDAVTSAKDNESRTEELGENGEQEQMDTDECDLSDESIVVLARGDDTPAEEPKSVNAETVEAVNTGESVDSEEDAPVSEPADLDQNNATPEISSDDAVPSEANKMTPVEEAEAATNDAGDVTIVSEDDVIAPSDGDSTLTVEAVETEETTDSLDTELAVLARQIAVKTLEATTTAKLEVETAESEDGPSLKRKRDNASLADNEKQAVKKLKVPGSSVSGKKETGAPSDKKEKEEVYEMTKTELEMLLISKVTEFFSDKEKSEIGALRLRCEQLEKSVENWRRKAGILQKQMIEHQIIYQRAIQKRWSTVGQRPSTRSVGLQVEFTRQYVPVGPPSSVTRVVAGGIRLPVPLVSSQTSVQPNQVLSNGPTSFVTNVGTTGALTGINAKAGVPFRRSPVRPQMQGPLTTGLIRPSSNPNGPSSVPIKMNAVSMLVNKTDIVRALLGSSSGMTVTRTAGDAYLRNAQDTAKVSAITSPPVPMRLVPNQAGVVVGPRPMAGVQPVQKAGTTPASSPIRQVAAAATTSVRIIDLTSDEDPPTIARQIQQAVGRAKTTVVASSSAVGAIPSVMSPLSHSNSITVLNPETMTTAGHIITFGGGGNSGGVVQRTVNSTVRPATATSLGGSTPVRLAYLMSSLPGNQMMSVMRSPSQPMLVSSSDVSRATRMPGQRMPTFVLQSGATLVPIQSGQALPSGRPTIYTGPRGGATLTTSVNTLTSGAPLAGGGANTPIIRVTRPPSIFNAQSSSFATRPPAPSVVSLPKPGTIVAKTVVPPASLMKVKLTHPAPLPVVLPPPSYSESMVGKKSLPPKPVLKISKVANGIVLSWNMQITATHAEVASYQLFAYQEGSAMPSTTLWKKVGDVKALPLPMACTLTQFVDGHKYYFAVRAVDIHTRFGPFSEPGCIALLKTNK